jgi:alkylation response protein AidB-like acyl-CoA dehydrogenase
MVPKSNLLGKENEGFSCIVSNFNHERWMILITANRYNRLMVEECLKWTH